MRPDLQAATVGNTRGMAWMWWMAIGAAVAYGAISAAYGGRLAVVLLLPVFPIVLILRDLRIGVLLLMFLFPFQHTPFLPQFTGFNLVNYCVAACMLSLLLKRMLQASPLAPFPWWIALAFVVPVAAATLNGLRHLDTVPLQVIHEGSIYYGSPRGYVIGMVLKPMLAVLAAWMLGCALVHSKKPERLLFALVAASILPALSIIMFVILNGFDLRMLASERARETLGNLGLHANEFGLLLSISFTLSLFLLPEVKTAGRRTMVYASIVLCAVSLLLTFSRGGYASAVLAVVCYMLRYRQLRNLGVLLACAAVLLAIGPDILMARLSTGIGQVDVGSLAQASNDPLTAGRVWIWKQVMPDFWRHPWFGSGVGSMAWSGAVLQGRVAQIHPHNLYVRILLDMGVVGLLLMALFTSKLLGWCKRIAADQEVPALFRAHARGMRVAIAALLLGGLANGKYLPESELTLLWMGIGLLLPFMHAADAPTVAPSQA